MRGWRLTRPRYQRDPLSGFGAARAGSRWNSPGVRVGYASTSRPLAVLEMPVHVGRDAVPDDLVLIPIEVPDELVEQAANLPHDWNRLPFSLGARGVGDRWAADGRAVALAVPSVVLPLEKNLLVNPLHPDFLRVGILPPEPFSFDRRLLR